MNNAAASGHCWSVNARMINFHIFVFCFSTWSCRQAETLSQGFEGFALTAFARLRSQLDSCSFPWWLYCEDYSDGDGDGDGDLRHLSRASRKSKRFEKLFLIATFASLCDGDGDEWKALTWIQSMWLTPAEVGWSRIRHRWNNFSHLTGLVSRRHTSYLSPMVLVNVEKHFTGVGKFQIEGKKCTFLWTNCVFWWTNCTLGVKKIQWKMLSLVKNYEYNVCNKNGDHVI